VAGAESRWLVSIAVMLTTVMVILDMTIVNVALPQMMGSLGATSDQITWVLTGYIVAEAIVIPLTGFLAAWLGRRRLMLVSVAGFVISSGLCGQAMTLSQIVLFRILQGAFGASVVPLSQSIMVDTFAGEERGKAMAIWGVGIMLGPILGPTIGGYITQHLDWRWVFYINLPVGLVNLWMIQRYVSRGSATGYRRTDWLGAAAMAVGIGCLQYVLDRGNQDDWFASSIITVLAALSAVALTFFVARSWRRDDSVMRLHLLKDRNLATASLMMFAFGLGLFGTIALQPLMLERLFDYPAETTGLVMAPRGLASAFAMFMVSRLITRLDARVLILSGLALAAGGTYVMSWYSLDISPAWVVWPGVLQGLGMGMIFVPLSAIAYQSLPREATDHASGIFNLARTIGASTGISAVSTVVTRTSQTSWNELGGHLTPYNPALHDWLRALGLSLQNPRAAHLLGEELSRQASMVGFVDAFHFVTLNFLVLAFLVCLLRGSRRR